MYIVDKRRNCLSQVWVLGEIAKSLLSIKWTLGLYWSQVIAFVTNKSAMQCQTRLKPITAVISLKTMFLGSHVLVSVLYTQLTVSRHISDGGNNWTRLLHDVIQYDIKKCLFVSIKESGFISLPYLFTNLNIWQTTIRSQICSNSNVNSSTMSLAANLIPL